ncbi:probable disease resistance protein At4g33300 [Cryptomeria japonica]|uniref:probable disease resistance protein At4g33300 n=1 Tax=Cryptomeria japonica TaxID=3369 RepID=UPI0027DA14BF|nr:probable disease resistance protein At4g33300 [Cryptomeria japonica]
MMRELFVYTKKDPQRIRVEIIRVKFGKNWPLNVLDVGNIGPEKELNRLQKSQRMDSVQFIDSIEMEEDSTCVVPGDCFWSFGQTPIPSTANAILVKELLAECDGLPHALKAIGSSLHGKSHEAWERVMKKISKGESISDYHKKGLIRLLQINIDSLDDVAKECFQDLGLFPEDRKICVDTLLGIWVYVRNLQCHNAFAILSELASKNLLNLTSTSG